MHRRLSTRVLRALLASVLFSAAARSSQAQERDILSTLSTLSSVGRAAVQPASPFVIQPYLQLGDAPKAGKREQMALIWHTSDTDAVWSVETRPAGETGAKWSAQGGRPLFQQVAVAGVDAHRVWTAPLTDLKPGALTAYRVLKGDVPVFESTLLPRKASGQKQRVVVFGDCSVDSSAQRKIAYQTYLAKPDYVFITGDIVYNRGRISEYRSKYFPIYNADIASPASGAPLIRSTLFLAAPGNHDILHPDFDKAPDSLAYFLYWKQPMNGPTLAVGGPNVAPMTGPEVSQRAFLAAAGSAYPRMANYSFDYGDVHWTVLDADPYVNWNEPALRDWLRQDLEKAKGAKWRFVGFHQPGFNSSVEHFDEQQMRVVANLFEEGGVDLVFNGHVHNYQRTYPMRFATASGQTGKGRVNGVWTLDKDFDGVTKTKPSGVLYLVTGAGGADLYNPEQTTKPETWQPFTKKFVADVHSMTQVDIDGRRLTVKQISDDGKELDAFTVTK
ncbi:MAG: metallophosphoesterase [Cytophagales bacterium]|nr:metallophosphoesterase [Armatimonadota bacterium]